MNDAVHISDSIVYGHSWKTPELSQLFSERARIRGWLEVMMILAETQAEKGLIPIQAAYDIRKTYENLSIDDAFLAEFAADFEKTNHSLHGLIKAVQRRCDETGGEWLCFGVTVQDITDTHCCRILVKILDLFLHRILSIEKVLIELAQLHRNTIMCGRTHGQIGLPITFGYKVAVWLDELERHRQRLLELKPRLSVVQLAGGVGSLSSLGNHALEVQSLFAEKLKLSPPLISWTTSRDRYAEWVNCLAMIAATGDRIGHEIYNLQRPEIGELSEGFISGTIGSITMPQKQNPEISEHLGTLARTIRHHAAHMMENLVHDHERDGRSWKSEWLILPEVSMATDKILSLLLDLLPNLQVHAEQMLKNLSASNGSVFAEAVMLLLSQSIGKQSAHTQVYECALRAVENKISFKDAVMEDSVITKRLSDKELDKLFNLANRTGQCQNLVDQVIESIKLD